MNENEQLKLVVEDLKVCMFIYFYLRSSVCQADGRILNTYAFFGFSLLIYIAQVFVITSQNKLLFTFSLS